MAHISIEEHILDGEKDRTTAWIKRNPHLFKRGLFKKSGISSAEQQEQIVDMAMRELDIKNHYKELYDYVGEYFHTPYRWKWKNGEKLEYKNGGIIDSFLAWLNEPTSLGDFFK